MLIATKRITVLINLSITILLDLFKSVFPNLKLNIGGDDYIKTFYHGTSNILDVKKMILPPIQTNILREGWRKKYLDKVFFTTSLLAAKRYAKKICKKYGGSPVIYIVKPIGQYFNRINIEYIADKAKIIGQV